jgi:phosphoglucosamine mutase
MWQSHIFQGVPLVIPMKSGEQQRQRARRCGKILLSMGKYFGTDGIRGQAGEFPLVESAIECIGASLTSELQAKKNRQALIVIGRDSRESGEWIEAAFVRGACANGAKVHSAGIITTPGVAYLARALGADAGVVISASHNPYQDNGIKIFGGDGRKLDDDTEQAIERCLSENSNGKGNVQGSAPQPDPQLRAQYLAYLRERIAGGLKLDGLKLVVDCANGAAYELGPELFSQLGAEVVPINVEPNGRNINLNCGSLHPSSLQQAVRDAKADAGLAFDGDADRLLLVDERGNLVDGDQVLHLMAKYLDARGKLSGRRVVATVMSNLGLEVALAERGITLVRTPVGDKNVLEELLKNGGTVGGEQSGHIIFPEISLAGDGLITAIEVLRAMRDESKTLHELVADFVSYPQVIVNVRVSKKPPFDSIPPLQTAIASLEKQMANRGRLLVRYSGTENLARIMLEGEDKKTIQQQADDLAKLIQQHIG